MSDSFGVAIKGGLHACLAVSDLEAGVDWYQRVLGFQPFQRHIYREYDVRVAYLRKYGSELELVETHHPKPCQRDDPPRGHVALRGISQLSFRVTDMAATLDRLQRLNVAVVFGPVESTEFNLKACFVRDHEGNLIEFIERL